MGATMRQDTDSNAPVRFLTQERVARLMTAVSVLVGLTGVVWIWQSRKAARSKANAPNPQFASSPRAPMNAPGGAPGQIPGNMFVRGMFGMGMFGARRTPPPGPRYFANLSIAAGDYVVSVRQAMHGEQRGSLFDNLPPNEKRPPLEDLRVAIQVMSPVGKPTDPVHGFAPGLFAVDDTGRRLDALRVEPFMDFPKGRSWLVRLPAPAPGAKYLKRIEGELLVGAPRSIQSLREEAAAEPSQTSPTSGNQKRVKFNLEDIPLPVTNHVFGVAGVAFLGSSRLAALGLSPSGQETAEGVRVFTGAEADALRTLFPPHTPEPNPLRLPARLILQSDAPAHFPLFLPGGSASPRALQCHLLPKIDPGGEIALEAEIVGQEASSPIRFSWRVWENEPVVALLPARRLGYEHKAPWIALLLHLYWEIPPDRPPGQSIYTPFPAGTGERGGVLVGTVTVEEAPLRSGRAQMETQRLDTSGNPTEEMTLEVILDRAGQWRFANVSPGRYRIRLSSVQQYRSAVTAPLSWEDYLRRRYGLKQPVWKNAAQECVVRAGGHTTLPPARAVEAAKQELGKAR